MCDGWKTKDDFSVCIKLIIEETVALKHTVSDNALWIICVYAILLLAL
jgi:hypothetical protein